MNPSSMETPMGFDENSIRLGMYEEELKKFNWNLIILEVVLFAIGIWNMISATSAADKSAGLYRSQLLWFGMGMAMSALVSTVIMATLVVGPFYLSRALGLDAARVGLVLSVGPLVAALTA